MEQKLKHTLLSTALSSQEAMPEGKSITSGCIADEQNDGYGYARVRQTVSHALRNLSPLSAASVDGISKCVAERSGMIGTFTGAVEAFEAGELLFGKISSILATIDRDCSIVPAFVQWSAGRISVMACETLQSYR